jgi:uncharacterized protein
MTTSPSSPGLAGEGRRDLSVPAYVVAVVVYLVIVQGVALLFQDENAEYGVFRTVDEVLQNLWLPVGSSMIFAILLVTWLGWWKPVFKEDRPVAGWVKVVPILMVITIVAGINYGGLSDAGLGFTIVFLIGALFVGFTEEVMFRGVGVTAFRRAGYPEAKVALFVAIVFGAAHGTNIFTEGAGALLQIGVTIAAGFYFYLVRRATGGITAAIFLHGLWDFGLFTGNLQGEPYAGMFVFVLVDVVIGIVLLVRRKHIGVTPASELAPA